MSATHTYELSLEWTGNRGQGTRTYRGYGREHEVRSDGKPTIAGSSDPGFRGDAARWNPEELFVAALSQCHLLVYLHEAAAAGVVVSYSDTPVGAMTELADGAGQFDRVILRPVVVVAEESMCAPAQALHEDAHSKCFIARSVSCPVVHEPVTRARAVAVATATARAPRMR